MNDPTEQDMELLEAWLDDALDGPQTQALRHRLAAEPALAAAADELRRQRDLRHQYFATLEGDDAAVERLVRSVRKAAVRQQAAGRSWRIGLRVAAVAACLLLAFFGGWLGRTMFSGKQSPVVQNPTQTVTIYQVALTDDAGRVLAVQKFPTLEAAREFADDVDRWQDRQRTILNGVAIVRADRF